MSALTITAVDGTARTGTLRTAHGEVRLPAFMPVGTHAAVKAVHPAEVRACGADILLCNAYHLALRPGAELVERLGGLQELMRWDGPILTDSGGYQLVSLDGVAALDDEGATFVSPYDGSRLRVGPEEAVALQARLGADVIMCLDHPVAYGAPAARAAEATARTHRWAERCRRAHPGRDRHLLFGIAQGGFDAGERRRSAEIVAGLDFDGIAIGGLALGEPPPVMEAMAGAALERIPEERPRYVMGLGTDAELLAMVALGVDMFDCVLPTRLARNGTALTCGGRLSLRRAVHREDRRPLEDGCPCPACAGGFSRAYLRHLFTAGEILAHRLLSLHNLTHLGGLMEGTRRAIAAGRFAEYRRTVLAGLAGGPDSRAAVAAAAACAAPPVEDRAGTARPSREEEIHAATLGAPVLIDGPIALSDYDPRWPELFEREAARIRAVLGDDALLVEHCGSTAVPGLCAKPIIDIVLAVSDSADEPSYVPRLEGAGYALRIREPGWWEHRLLKGPDTDVNVHVLSAGCPEIERMLRFRDTLRADRAERTRYERAKRTLAARRWRYVQDYADAKSEVVESIIARATRGGADGRGGEVGSSRPPRGGPR